MRSNSIKKIKRGFRFLPHTAIKWLLQTHRIVTNVPEFHEQKSNQLAYCDFADAHCMQRGHNFSGMECNFCIKLFTVGWLGILQDSSSKK